ncbi:PorP/SprF family type IX secretion system membrane protein [Myroides pelagicus]|uniref:Type IX secretion system membrane protein PorP/SprF n=1 Tax=Myroides pelagicus TaxID=270914 RepID=A0A7K1GKD0_9FLAO|nr:type IX secretion system membrane protein PorP/SprF [Myroides pelagicus]MEC4112864.1 type IX secretion system membrane protein PorP/SprF [Myroides pelagicus]MTH28674.1 type IX secretion system membrane protein PorP/SprF [Myroides pelagicus]
MNKIFRNGYLVLVLLVAQLGKAQEGMPVYSEYLADNYYLLHPAMAGIKNSLQGRMTTRQQWSGVDDAPRLMTLNASARLNDQSAIGGVFYNDKNGYHSQAGFKGTYAYHLTFSESRYDLHLLSFGISAGFARTSLDESEFGGFDPNVDGSNTLKDSYFTVDVGAAYHYKNFFSMLTVKNAVTSKSNLYSDVESNNLRKYMAGAGYAFGNTKYGTGWIYEPSTLIQYTEKLDELSFDINMKVYRQFEFGRLWGGISYRTNLNGADYEKLGEIKTQRLQYFTPLIGGNYRNFTFSYAYTQPVGDVKFTNSGFHQFTIGVNLFPKRVSLDCNCPTVKD